MIIDVLAELLPPGNDDRPIATLPGVRYRTRAAMAHHDVCFPEKCAKLICPQHLRAGALRLHACGSGLNVKAITLLGMVIKVRIDPGHEPVKRMVISTYGDQDEAPSAGWRKMTGRPG